MTNAGDEQMKIATLIILGVILYALSIGVVKHFISPIFDDDVDAMSFSIVWPVSMILVPLGWCIWKLALFSERQTRKLFR